MAIESSRDNKPQLQQTVRETAIHTRTHAHTRTCVADMESEDTGAPLKVTAATLLTALPVPRATMSRKDESAGNCAVGSCACASCEDAEDDEDDEDDEEDGE